jgi:hypothetical protein
MPDKVHQWNIPTKQSRPHTGEEYSRW